MFIHRDYHPGNTLWLGERLAAIVDWSSASFGPPGIDLSHMRANLAILFDVQTANVFLEAHRRVVGAGTGQTRTITRTGICESRSTSSRT